MPENGALVVCVWLFNVISDEMHNDVALYNDDERQQFVTRVVDETEPALPGRAPFTLQTSRAS